MGGTNIAIFNPICGSERVSLDVSQPLVNLLVSKSVERDMPDLVCIGMACDPKRLTPRAMAILTILVVLLFIGLFTYAYQRRDAWAHILLSNPFVNWIISRFAVVGVCFEAGRRKIWITLSITMCTFNDRWLK